MGADVGVMIDLGWAPLHAAAYCGHADVAQALLAKGAEPRAAVLPEGWTALHMAAQFGAVGVVQALVQVSCHLHSALRYWQYEQMQHEVTSKLHVDIPQPRKASLTSGELFFVRPNMPCYCKQGCWISCQRLWHYLHPYLRCLNEEECLPFCLQPAIDYLPIKPRPGRVAADAGRLERPVHFALRHGTSPGSGTRTHRRHPGISMPASPPPAAHHLRSIQGALILHCDATMPLNPPACSAFPPHLFPSGPRSPPVERNRSA